MRARCTASVSLSVYRDFTAISDLDTDAANHVV